MGAAKIISMILLKMATFLNPHTIMFGVKRRSMITIIKIANSVDMWNKASMSMMVWFMQI